MLSTLQYFRHEYEEHVRDKYCSARVCRGLGTYIVIQSECILCGECVRACAFDAVKETRDTFFIEQDYCTKCKACYNVCPTNAIKVVKKEEADELLAAGKRE